MGYKQLNNILLSVIKLVGKWQLSEAEKLIVLGFDPKNIPSEITPDQEQRLSLLLNIHSELRHLFTNPANIYGYMTMINHNPPFNGKRPVDLAGENLDGLHSVYYSIKVLAHFERSY
ncbi:hypothetical protein [Flavobacterium sp. W21_SRS_FM6]|uniref:hypothetical protein n=1 Tax=Flavobacterium sp. W21_SRS_FM6 TaxID=3240268 RepID=UPI003F906770